MSEIKLAEYRRRKGLTQEQLAELSGVTTRTIQRIEKGVVVPHQQTLKMLADALDVEAELLTNTSECAVDTARPVKPDLLPIFHLLGLIGLLCPGLNVILPLTLWIFKKGENPEYDRQGRLVVNFHSTLTLAFYVSTMVMVFIFEIGFPMLLLSYLLMASMSIINLYCAIKSLPIKYPFSFPFFGIHPTA